MGGVDKGLQAFRGQSLAANAMSRLAPQVGSLMLNANRHLDVYAALGAPVWPDATADHPGPLAGFLAGLEHCQTDWLVTVPCDAPLFPLDLVERLVAAIDASSANLAIPATPRAQPVFCLMRRTLVASLRGHLQAGGSRQVEAWVRSLGGIEVSFSEAAAFVNVNTQAELDGLQANA